MSTVARAADTAPPARAAMTTGGFLALSFYWLPTNLFWTVMLQAFLPGRVAEFAGDAQKGTYLLYIAALGAVATTVIQLIIGPISDASANRMGRRHPFILWGTALAAAGIIGFALSQNFAALMVSFFAIQLFLNVATGPYQALMPDSVPHNQHGLASAYMGASLLLGQLLGVATLAAVAFLHVPVAAVLIGVTIMLLVGAVITVARVPDAPAPPDRQKSPGEALSSLTRLGFRKHRDFFGLLYSRFFINLSYSTVTAYLLYYLQDSIGPKEKGSINLVLVILVATIAGLVGTLLVGRFTDRVSKKRLVYISCTILAFGAAIFAFIHSMLLVLVIAFVFGAGWGAFSAVDWALAVNLLPEPGEGAARYMAVWHFCLTMPQVLAPLFGPVADYLNAHYGTGAGWRAAMLSTVLYLAIGTALLHRVQERVE